MEEKFLDVYRELLNGHDINHIMYRICGSISQIFDEPIFGFADANDPIFDEFKKTNVVGPWFRKPTEWMKNAKTVVSFFLPYSDEIIKACLKAGDKPAEEWAYGRVEGQDIVDEYTRELAECLEREGAHCDLPTQHNDFFAIVNGHRTSRKDEMVFEKEFYTDPNVYSSVWSERHIAFAAGLGTFGLSKALITKKGVAGRFGSLVTDYYIEPTKREYTDIYEYCNMCGECADRCPVHAIPHVAPKIDLICQGYVDLTRVMFDTRYGCGLCQTNVPCMREIPKKK